MKNYQVFCASCGIEYDNEWWLCPNCQGSLIVRYLNKQTILQFPSKLVGLGLGEGKIPLIFLPKISKELGIELWAKCEYQNPTGSFKDRGSLIEVSKAIEFGMSGVVCASTGNMAASLAAYAARNGLQCVVVVPNITPDSKLQQAAACGATLMRIDGEYDVCVNKAIKLAQKKNLFLCGDYLLRREGQKTIGWELAQYNFDGFVVPVGNGNVGIAIAQGISEANQNLKQPKFIGIQAKNVNPIEKAWRTQKAIKPQNNTQTIATAFNVGNPLDGDLTISWLDRTQGLLTTVTETEIIIASRELANKEGLYVESTAATTLAGIKNIKEQLKGQKIVLILTGSGLKERK